MRRLQDDRTDAANSSKPGRGRVPPQGPGCCRTKLLLCSRADARRTDANRPGGPAGRFLVGMRVQPAAAARAVLVLSTGSTLDEGPRSARVSACRRARHNPAESPGLPAASGTGRRMEKYRTLRNEKGWSTGMGNGPDGSDVMIRLMDLLRDDCMEAVHRGWESCFHAVVAAGDAGASADGWSARLSGGLRRAWSRAVAACACR